MTTTHESESSLLRNFGWNEVEMSGGGELIQPMIAPQIISFQNMASRKNKIKAKNISNSRK